MSKQIRSFSIRGAVEQGFAALAFVSAIAVSLTGTVAMCFPGLGVA